MAVSTRIAADTITGRGMGIRMPVGFRQGRFEDPARTNWDGSAPRPLSWAAWYPASDDASERELFTSPPAAPEFSIGPAAPDAPIGPARRRYPIVLLSHGTGGTVMHLEWLARDLAHRGFIAIGVDHHGNTAAEPYRAEGFLCWWERARDLTVLLDRIDASGAFAGHVDMNRVFVAGYSLGGCTAAALLGAVTATSRFQSSPSNKDFGRGPREFPDLADHLPGLIESSAIFRESWARMSNDYRDARFKTAFLMAPGRSVLGFSEKSFASIETPTRIVVGGSDFVQPAAIWLHGRLRTGKLDSLASEAGHYVFLPEATDAGRRADPTCWIDAPGVDRRSVHKHVAALAAELFLPG
jgi:predicted dienelactone hydrolase